MAGGPLPETLHFTAFQALIDMMAISELSGVQSQGSDESSARARKGTVFDTVFAGQEPALAIDTGGRAWV